MRPLRGGPGALQGPGQHGRHGFHTLPIGPDPLLYPGGRSHRSRIVRGSMHALARGRPDRGCCCLAHPLSGGRAPGARRHTESQHSHSLSSSSAGFIPKDFDDTLNRPFYLEGLAEVVAAQGEGVWAARLWGAAASLREELPSPQPSVFRAGYEQAVAAARRQLGQKVFAAAWAQGRSMTFEQVLGPQGRETIPEEGSSGAPLAVARTQPTYPAGFSA